MRAPLLAPCQEDEVCTKGRSRCRLRHKGGSTRNQAVISLIYIFSSHLLPPFALHPPLPSMLPPVCLGTVILLCATLPTAACWEDLPPQRLWSSPVGHCLDPSPAPPLFLLLLLGWQVVG